MRIKKDDYIINSKLTVSIILSILFTVIGLLAMNMEVFEDAWYIESSADGLFGSKNIGLSVLCSHWLLTSLIHLLSLTGVRLFWFNIILVLGVLISHVINIYILSYKKQNNIYIVESIGLLMLLTPMLLSQLNMTEISAYIVVTGCILTIYGIDIERKRSLVFGNLWIVFGGIIRIDCLAFGVIFMGMYFSVEVLIKFFKVRFSFKETIKLCKKQFIIGIVFIVEVCVLFGTYWYGHNKSNPTFLEWNTVRSYVNDYELPQYSEYENQYNEIGITKSDYDLLKTWNNYDPDVFTLKKYSEINNLRMDVLNEQKKNNGLFFYFMDGLGKVQYQIAYWCILFIFFIGLIFSDKRNRIFGSCIFILFYLLIFYFSLRGRFTLHIQHAVLVSTIIFLSYIFFNKKVKGNYYLWIVAIFLLSFYKIPYGNQSLFSNYVKQVCAEDSFFSARKQKYSYLTYNLTLSDTISKDKENIYFAPISQIWLQNYPLAVINPFVTADENKYSNFSFFSAYMPELTVSKQVLKNYGINNPLKDIIKDNVRLVVREEEISSVVIPLINYIREHYYEKCNYKIVKKVEGCLILRFVEE